MYFLVTGPNSIMDPMARYQFDGESFVVTVLQYGTLIWVAPNASKSPALYLPST